MLSAARGTPLSEPGTSGPLSVATDAYSDLATAGTSSYTYDALGRTVTDAPAAGSAYQLSYVGSSPAIASDGTSAYAWNPSGTMLDGTGAPGGGTGGTLALTDTHGNQVGQFTASGTSLSGSRAYDPWGNPAATTGAMTGLLGYQSAWSDAASGKDLMSARWYNPAAGDFTSADTIQVSPVPDPAAGNPFAYAADAPLDYTDPTGHFISTGGPAQHPVDNQADQTYANVYTNDVYNGRSARAQQDAAAAAAKLKSQQAAARAAAAKAAKIAAAKAAAAKKAKEQAAAKAAKKAKEQAAAKAAAAKSGCGFLGLSCAKSAVKSAAKKGWDDFTGSQVGGCVWSSVRSDCGAIIKDAGPIIVAGLTDGEGDPIGGDLEPVIPTGDGPAFGPAPKNAWTTLDRVAAKGSPLPGYKGGSTFENDGSQQSEILPSTTSGGDPISYREWDVNPNVRGVDRGGERVVTGSVNGKMVSAYYTSNHYRSFVQFVGGWGG